MRFAHKLNKVHPSDVDQDDSDDSHVHVRLTFILYIGRL